MQIITQFMTIIAQFLNVTIVVKLDITCDPTIVLNLDLF